MTFTTVACDKGSLLSYRAFDQIFLKSNSFKSKPIIYKKINKFKYVVSGIQLFNVWNYLKLKHGGKIKPIDVKIG